jgi:hypothetical protein
MRDYKLSDQKRESAIIPNFSFVQPKKYIKYTRTIMPQVNTTAP